MYFDTIYRLDILHIMRYCAELYQLFDDHNSCNRQAHNIVTLRSCAHFLVKKDDELPPFFSPIHPGSVDGDRSTGEVVEILTWYLFRELTYPTYGKGKSSSQLPVKGLEGTVFSLWILVEILRFSASMCKNILFEFPQRWDEIWNAVFQNQESKAQEFKQFSFHIYLCTTYIYVCMHACDFT